MRRRVERRFALCALVLGVAGPVPARADAIGPCPPGEHVVGNPTRPGAMHHGGFHCEPDLPPHADPRADERPAEPPTLDERSSGEAIEAALADAERLEAERARAAAAEAERARAVEEASRGVPFVPPGVSGTSAPGEPVSPAAGGGCGCAAAGARPTAAAAWLAVIFGVCALARGRRRTPGRGGVRGATTHPRG